MTSPTQFRVDLPADTWTRVIAGSSGTETIFKLQTGVKILFHGTTAGAAAIQDTDDSEAFPTYERFDINSSGRDIYLKAIGSATQVIVLI